MSKIGVNVGEEFPVEDPSHGCNSSDQSQPSRDSHSQNGDRDARPNGCHDRAEFERWKWRREGERLWQDDVRNERTEWEARKQAFKEKIRAAVHEAVGNHVNGRHHAWGHTWRWRLWPLGTVGMSIAVLALAMHRHGHSHRRSGCRTYDDSDIETPRSPRPSSSRTADEGPIITPPRPREH
jgi:hypothetical protein